VGVSTTYMLKVTDGNGCTAVSFISVRIDPCLSIDEAKLGGKLLIYPNPSSGRFKLSGIDNHSSKLLGIEILNRLGQVVYKRDDLEYFSGEMEIESRITEGGIYFLRVRFSDRIVSERLIIR
jgi:hypothetical protein